MCAVWLPLCFSPSRECARIGPRRSDWAKPGYAGKLFGVDAADLVR